MPKDKTGTARPKHCIFCDIIDHKRQERDIVIQTEEVVVFHDASPASTHHLLACPTRHIKDCKQLTKQDIQLVRLLESTGLEALSRLGANTQDSRLGFHWPPYNSVHHLHLHVLSPASRVRCGKFTIGGKAFKTVEQVIKHLEKLPEETLPQEKAPSAPAKI